MTVSLHRNVANLMSIIDQHKRCRVCDVLLHPAPPILRRHRPRCQHHLAPRSEWVDLQHSTESAHRLCRLLRTDPRRPRSGITVPACRRAAARGSRASWPPGLGDLRERLGDILHLTGGDVSNGVIPAAKKLATAANAVIQWVFPADVEQRPIG